MSTRETPKKYGLTAWASIGARKPYTLKESDWQCSMANGCAEPPVVALTVFRRYSFYTNGVAACATHLPDILKKYFPEQVPEALKAESAEEAEDLDLV